MTTETTEKPESTSEQATSEQTGAEPTMEEILASIRKIIATDGSETAAADDDVLELTDVVEEAEIVPEAAPEIPASVIEEPPVAAAAPPQPVEEIILEDEPKAAEIDGQLVSPAAANLSANAFANLAEELDNQRVTLPPHVEIVEGKQTLEQLVGDIMRPLLKEWLDQNLPATVERLVQKEIERIARQHRD